MPRIIVTTDAPKPQHDAPVLLDEQVHSVHLSTGHAAAQLVERLAWAISDAEEAEAARREPGTPIGHESRRHPRSRGPHARLPIGA